MKHSRRNRWRSFSKQGWMLRELIQTAARSLSAILWAAPAPNLPPRSFVSCSGAMRDTAWSPCASAEAWAPRGFSNAYRSKLDGRSGRWGFSGSAYLARISPPVRPSFTIHSSPVRFADAVGNFAAVICLRTKRAVNLNLNSSASAKENLYGNYCRHQNRSQGRQLSFGFGPARGRTYARRSQ